AIRVRAVTPDERGLDYLQGRTRVHMGQHEGHAQLPGHPLHGQSDHVIAVRAGLEALLVSRRLGEFRPHHGGDHGEDRDVDHGLHERLSEAVRCRTHGALPGLSTRYCTTSKLISLVPSVQFTVTVERRTCFSIPGFG